MSDRLRRRIVRGVLVGSVSAAAALAIPGSASALALPTMTFLGTFSSVAQCNQAMDYNNGLGFPGQFACFQYLDGNIYGVYVDNV